MRWTIHNRTGRKSIFKKLLTGYIALTLLIVGLTSLVSFFLVRQNMISANLTELQTKARKLAETLSEPGGMTRTLTRSRLGELQVLSDAQLAYIDKNMRVQSLPPRMWPGSEDDLSEIQQIDVIDALDEQLIKQLLGGTPVTDVRKLDFMNDEVVFAGAPVIDEDGQILGAALLYRPLRQVSATTARIALMLLPAGVVAVAVAFVLAYVMGRRISRPLVLMNQTAKHIADGNYGERVRVFGDDEVGQLGATLNLLSGRLRLVIENLSNEKSKLQEVLVSIGEGLIAIDREGHVVQCNKAALELLQLSAWQVDTGDGLGRQQLLLSMMTESMADSEHVQADLVLEKRTIQAISSPILAEGGQVIGAVCLLRDISEAQRLEQMRKDYIANISHELRTPLTGIRGMVEPLMDGYMETAEQRDECYRIIYQETIRLEKLIGEMLDLSRLQDGRIQMELEPMQPRALMLAATRRMREKADKGRIALGLSGGGDDILVLGNENRIIQVLIILVDNAISFTPPGGTIELSVERQGRGMVAIGVQDSGAGISEEDLPYIFERFYKADKARMGTRGVGLGLPIARLVVELMGGQLSVSTKRGEGSKFTFTLREYEAGN